MLYGLIVLMSNSSRPLINLVRLMVDGSVPVKPHQSNPFHSLKDFIFNDESGNSSKVFIPLQKIGSLRPAMFCTGQIGVQGFNLAKLSKFTKTETSRGLRVGNQI